MKTFKVFLRDYHVETVTAENFAIDDQNNLVVGQNLFHKDFWIRIICQYYTSTEVVSPYDYNLDQPVSNYDPNYYFPVPQNAQVNLSSTSGL